MKSGGTGKGLARTRRPIWRRAMRCAGALLAGLVLWRGGDVLLGRNLGTIAAGQVYRSNQLSGPALREEIAVLKLRSVINLRGANAGDEWYRDETNVCQVAGVAHYDVKMSAVRLPTPETLARPKSLSRQSSQVRPQSFSQQATMWLTSASASLLATR